VSPCGLELRIRVLAQTAAKGARAHRGTDYLVAEPEWPQRHIAEAEGLSDMIIPGHSAGHAVPADLSTAAGVSAPIDSALVSSILARMSGIPDPGPSRIVRACENGG
jgi:hypothetical protein